MPGCDRLTAAVDAAYFSCQTSNHLTAHVHASHEEPALSDFDGIAGLDLDTIERRIRAFEAYGNHRTGWAADDRSGAWLRDELKGVGVAGALERFDFIRVEYRNARITWAGGFVEGTPMYDGGFTDFGGIQGELCDENDSDPFGKIIVAGATARGDQRWTGTDVRVFYDDLFEKGLIAAVVPTGDPDGNVVLRDALHIRTPFDIPVLQISAKDHRTLSTATMLGSAEVKLEADGERLKSRANNVVATVPGSDSEADPVVVLVQRSGWFGAAGERGAGVAIWLAVAEAIAKEQPHRPVQFLAASGAELRNTGLEFHLRAHPGLAKRSVTFLDLGPSLGARDASARIAASDAPLLEGAGAAVTSHFATKVPANEPGDPGDSTTAKSIATASPRYVSFSATHPYARSAGDTFDRVDLDATAAWARAALTTLRGILAEG